MDPLDVRLLRQTLGRFVTGVTVVATRDGDGKMVGLTVNSFTPVSTEHRLLLWSLSNRSRTLQAFERAHYFVVNVLAEHQVAVSKQMCAPVENRFAAIDWEGGTVSGLPIIAECAASFECRKLAQRAGGDHQIFLGEVVSFVVQDRKPLLYFGGGYAVAAPRAERREWASALAPNPITSR
ncbi:MAG TPA: flavin reductase family protein [Burkholderiales bacterium]|nr:flavin reductase family protein [Burkholderiales bacterium]